MIQWIYLTIKCEFLADVASTLPASVQKLQVSSAAHQKQQELLKQVAEQQFVPKEPPPEPEFVADPPSISALDLYVFQEEKNPSVLFTHHEHFVCFHPFQRYC